MFKRDAGPKIDFRVLENPIRDEIFSPERLEEYAQYLATELSITTEKGKGAALFPRIKENTENLMIAYQRLTDAVNKNIDISPAGEWIIDNFHIVEDQIREIKEDLPENYYLQLPKIKSGELAGRPRVYAIALALVAHLDSFMEMSTIERFIKRYQTVTPLLIGELWAIPIVLRIALVENLRRLANQTIFTQEIKEKTDLICDQILEKGDSEESARKLLNQLSDIYGKSEMGDSSMISQLSRRLHTRDPEALPAYEILEKYLAEQNIDIDEMVRSEHQMQGANLVSVSNTITSMRLLASVDWKEFFESVSLVDPVLAKDPAECFLSMDFASRDRYRDAVERIHNKTGFGEIGVCLEAVRLAQRAVDEKIEDKRKHHVGYYLVRNGVRQLEKKIGYIPTLKEKIKRKIFDHPAIFYLSSLILLTILLTIPPILYVNHMAQGFLWPLIIFFVVLIPASDSGLNVLNFFVTYFVGPFILPKINLDKGIPDNAKTFVVVPAIINYKESIHDLIENLETCYLTNRSENLSFALLTDFADADEETIEADKEILERLQYDIRILNKKYGREDFYLFHRKRLFNDVDKKWMGWERKRGKIEEFNRFLRGDSNTSFINPPVFSKFFEDVKYVITLDADTKLPRDSAKKLIGTILHPLNHPQFDKNTGMVKKGYSILQPRIGISPESAEASLFAKIYSGHTGIDPYTTAVSNVYQDLFREGSYTGKGLYVVDTFEASLKDRMPVNSILSHDLIEGAFARTALLTDIEFFDDYPSHYGTFAKRHHRWIRGDWQILQWLFSRIPNREGKMVSNPLSILSKWKIFDNLRRSLVAPATFIWLLLVWFFLPNHTLAWTLFILAVMLVPISIRTASKLLKYPSDISKINHLRGIFNDFIMNLTQLGILILALPYQTYLHLDAIIKTLYRVLISKKDLLVWRTAAQEETAFKKKSSFILDILIHASIPALVILVLLWINRPYSLISSGIFLIGWILSPLFFEKLSQPKIEEPFKFQAGDKDILKSIAFRTWNFFETFVTEEDNFLPPDNFQLDPKPVVARRTSPTNMGLYLLSTCSAYDFGFIGPNEMLTRLEQSLNTFKKMNRHYGHFLNWYDTSNLAPLVPEYISTVDSGNLAGHLLTVKQTLVEHLEKGPLPLNVTEGLVNTFKVMKEYAKKINPQHLDVSSLINNIDNGIDYLDQADPKGWSKYFDEAKVRTDGIKDLINASSKEHGDESFENLKFWIDKALFKIQNFKQELMVINDSSFVKEYNRRCIEIAKVCHQLVMEMDFSILYSHQRKLFTIGYHVLDGKTDDSYYDLLASEARLTSFISIAKDDIPEEHWFHLGRQMTSLYNRRVLVSWSASMFEYLMPLLVMKDYKGTLLNETHYAAVKQQIRYGKSKKSPWGISESGYNARDLQMNYQYGPFGVPGLGLKRGLSHDFVISPYSTALGAMVLLRESIDNFKKLISKGLLTRFGFYEAVDYTKDRVPPKKSFAIIKNFMAHHQGMSLVSLGNILHDNKMPNRFHQDPLVRSTELLLQERVPKRIFILHPREEETIQQGMLSLPSLPTLHQITSVNTEFPKVRILSNGVYTVVLTAVGSGYSQCDNFAVFRWVEDGTLDQDGQFLFIYDKSKDSLWSTTYQPLANNSKDYRTTFSEHKVEFWSQKDEITAHTEVIVSAKDNVELKRVILTNLSNEERTLDITSYAEPILSTFDTDIAHPAFNKLFITTEYIEERSALLAHRRKRSDKEEDLFGIHLVACDRNLNGDIEYETDRAQFLGRGNSLSKAFALKKGQKLSNTTGSVLDPVFSIRAKITLKAHQSTQLIFASGMTNSKEKALELIDHYQDVHIFDQEDQRSWTQSQINLKHLNVNIDDINSYQRLAGALIYVNRNVRAQSSIIEQNNKPQSALWAHGISGDLPILLTTINSKFDISLIKDLLRAHEYLKVKNICFDLVILSEESSTYHLDVHNELLHQVRVCGGQGLINQRGGIFILRKDIIPMADQILLKSVARVFLDAHQGPLKKQVKQFLTGREIPDFKLPEKFGTSSWQEVPIMVPKLEFFNDYGGFIDGGREYLIHLKKGQSTPSPWINVIANENNFGFLVSDSGSSYTWSLNSRENRITPWNNDPVSDPSGEMIYLYDRETHQSWSPTPNQARDDSDYLIRHGQGYTSFEHNSFEIGQVLTMYVSLNEAVKFVRLKLKNFSGKKRTLSVFYYLEWVLGLHRSKTGQNIITETDEVNNIFFARNPFALDFGERISFACANREVSSFTCDRRAFLGRNGNKQKPQGVFDSDLDGKFGAGLDPCLALKLDVDLDPGEEYEVIFLLGQSSSKEDIAKLVLKNLRPQDADQALTEAKGFWDKILETIQIKTPYPEIDIIINRWILYQNLTCRIWARTALYQSGGAYGFRDQLQDMTSMVHTSPEIVREYIQEAAAHQFPEGDVLHWWHPPSGKGVRTRFSDDRLWLPYVVDCYIRSTGDETILDEMVSFVEGPELTEGEDDLYLETGRSENKASIYDHCIRAINVSLKVGQHGLPLMGSGDWNDGMSEVGNKGKGESIWMAWFLGTNLQNFISICQKRDDAELSQTFADHLEKLKSAVETSGWDGKWYRRAYFDNGAPLGSSESEECNIDSIAQSWSVISKLGNKEHVKLALDSAKEYLVKEKDKMILLFTPAFDKTSQNPGYIKGYIPGVRENGAQYTQAAIWLSMAFAEAGRSDEAFELMQMLNPLSHSLNKKDAQLYQAEPYAIAADIYSIPSHLGRGGWSWYTGSASWYYRAITESLLGIYRVGSTLHLRPSLPGDINEYEIKYRFGSSQYLILVSKKGTPGLYIDGEFKGNDLILPLVDDNKTHEVRMEI